MTTVSPPLSPTMSGSMAMNIDSTNAKPILTSSGTEPGSAAGCVGSAEGSSTFSVAHALLPTPTSLPRSRIGLIYSQNTNSRGSSDCEPLREEDTDGVDNDAGTGMERSESEDTTAGNGMASEEEVQTFQFDDVEMLNDSQVESTHLPAVPTVPPPTSAINAFSSNVLIHRPFRARYARTDDPPVIVAPLAATSAHTDPSSDQSVPSLPPTPSYKRTFEEISPPALGATLEGRHASSADLMVDSDDDDTVTRDNYSPFSTTTTTVPRPHGHRHSFDSQRFHRSSHSVSHLSGGRLSTLRLDGDTSSGLRRRSPMSSRATSRDRRSSSNAPGGTGDDVDLGLGANLDRSKRRRPSGTPEEAEEVIRRLTGSSSMVIDPQLTSREVAPPGAAPRSRLSFPALDAIPSASSSSNSGSSSSRSGFSPRIGSSISDGFRDAVTRRASSNSPLPARQDRDSDATSSSMNRRRSTTSSFPSFPTFRRATTTSFQVSPPVVVGASANTSSNVTSGTTTALSPPPPGALLLRPRSARARPDPMREREFDPLVAFWREEREHERQSSEVERQGRAILDEANERLGRAERTLVEAVGRLEHHRSTGDLTLPSVPTNEPREDVEAEEEMPDLPEVSHLPMPSRSNHRRPVVTVRVGEGWGPRSRTTGSTVAVDGSTGTASTSMQDSPTFSSPPSSPRSSDDLPLGNSASRAFHFLSNLRSRRPRLSRNSTGVPPPEDSPVTTPDDTDRLNDQNWWLPSPTEGRPNWTEEVEVREAERLNERLLARRAVSDWDAAIANSTSTDIPTSATREALWGDVSNDAASGAPSTRRAQGDTAPSLSLSRYRRMRGPTERANEQWRMGNGPNLASMATATTTVAHHTRSSTLPNSTSDPPVPWRSPSTVSPGWWESSSTREAAASASARAASRTDGDRRWRARTLNERNEMDFDDLIGELSPWDATDRSNTTRGTRGSDTMRDQQRATFGGSTTSRLRPEAPSFVPSSTTSSDTATGEGNRSSAEDALLDRDHRASIRINPRPIPRSASTRTQRAPFFMDDEEDSDPTRAAGNSERARVSVAGLPMLPSGSLGRRLVFPHPAATAGPYPPVPDGNPRSRYHPAFGFEATRYDTNAAARAATLPTAPPVPDAALNSSEDSSPGVHHTLGRMGHRRNSLADALAHFGARHDANDATLRRRHTSEVNRDGAFETGDRMLQRQARSERLASLRRERTAVRALGEDATRDIDPTFTFGLGPESPPRSPGGGTSPPSRRRGFSDLLRGFRGGHIFGEEFGAFFGRDSAALDPRNYLDDDDFDASYESLLRLSERLGDVKPKGVPQDKLAALRKFTYKEWPMPPRRDSTAASGVATTSAVTMDEEMSPYARKGVDKEERCAVCLVDYEEDDECTLGHCNHGFHSECLLAWLKERGTCPVCRKDHAA